MKNIPREESIGAQMAIALQLVKRKNHQAISKTGYKITMEQLAVLGELYLNKDLNMTELSRNIWKQNANITRIVDKLEKQNWVERKPVAGDRRAYLIEITKEGKQVYKKLIPIVTKVYKDVISCISKEEEEITLSSLKKIIAHLS